MSEDKQIVIGSVTVFVLIIVIFVGMMKLSRSNDFKRWHESGLSVVNAEITQFDFEGHKYLTRHQGGIAHAESCTNTTHYLSGAKFYVQ